MTDIRSMLRFYRCWCIAWAIGIASHGALAVEPAPPTTAPTPDETPPPKFLAAWGQEGTLDGQFKSPIGIAINAADEVFITDARKNCVQRFTSDGKFLDKFDTGAFPGGIAIDCKGLIYVAAMMDYKISVFRHKPASKIGQDSASAYDVVREWGKK